MELIGKYWATDKIVVKGGPAATKRIQIIGFEKRDVALRPDWLNAYTTKELMKVGLFRIAGGRDGS